MYIHVTEEHLVKGNPSSAWFCPVAMAISEKVDAACYVTKDGVGGNRWVIGQRGRWVDHLISPRAGRLIEKLMAGGTVKPFRFKLPKEFQKELDENSSS